MESINGQRRVNGCAHGPSVGADAVVGHNVVLLSSLEDHNAEQKQIPSCNVGDEGNSYPAIRSTVLSSNDMTKLERLDDRVSVFQCTALVVGTI